MDDWFLDKEEKVSWFLSKEEKENLEKIFEGKVIASTCFDWVITYDLGRICTKSFVAGEKDNRLIILAGKRRIIHRKETTVTTEYEPVALLPRKWFKVYEVRQINKVLGGEPREFKYYAVIVDDGDVAFYDDLDFLLNLVKSKWQYHYKKQYKGAIAYLLEHYISEHIEMDDFKKKFGVDLRKCWHSMPFCETER
jgi:hypothetical protein